LYIDGNDNLYICDSGNNRIQKWLQGAANGTTVCGSSSGSSGTTSTLLDNPMDLTFDNNGYMYVVDYGNNRVQRFAPNSTNGTTVAGTITSSAALTSLYQPTAIVIANDFNIYILDMGNTRVMKWAPNATSGTVLINAGNLVNSFDMLLAPDSSNQVYISDQDDQGVCLWAFNASSPVITLTNVNGSSPNSLDNPQGIVLDPYGNLYVADRNNGRVVMYCANSTMGIVIAQNLGGTTLQDPMAIAFDSNLNLYVLTKDHGQVMKFSRI
jgi:sugar lactone lactonase YvrE